MSSTKVRYKKPSSTSSDSPPSPTLDFDAENHQPPRSTRTPNMRKGSRAAASTKAPHESKEQKSKQELLKAMLQPRKKSDKAAYTAPVVNGEEPYARVLGTTLYPYDMRSLDLNGYYTCTIVHVYAAWLTRNLIKPALRRLAPVPQRYSPPRIRILEPTLAHLFKLGDAHARAQAMDRDMFTCDYLFVPLSGDNVDKDGGCEHWALLVVCVKSERARLFDSQAGLLEEDAVAFLMEYRHEFTAFHRGHADHNAMSEEDDQEPWRLTTTPSPQDPSAQNCGPIVCWLLKTFINRILETETDWGQTATSTLVRDFDHYGSDRGLIRLPLEDDYWRLDRAIAAGFDAVKERGKQMGLVSELADLDGVEMI